MDHLKLSIDSRGVPVCEKVEKISPNLKCPVGSQNPDKKGFCETVISKPLDSRCPEGFHLGPQESEQKRKHLGPKSIDWGEPPGTQIIPGN